MRCYRLGLPLLVAIVLAGCQSAPQKNVPPADIQVHKGPTLIQGGDARSAEDITIATPYFAFTIAGSGQDKAGSIVDMALVENGVFGADRIVSLDFLPGEGSITLHGIDITEQSPERVVVEVDRSWNGHRLQSRYEVEKAYPGIKLSSRLDGADGQTLFAGYRLLQNASPLDAGAAPAVLTQTVLEHWSQGQLQQGLSALSEVGDLRRNHKPGQQQFDAWLSAGSLGQVLADGLVTVESPNTVISLYEYDDSSDFEARMAQLRQRWNRGERVYLSANKLLRGPRQNSGRLYAYTPNGNISADFASAASKGHSFVSFGPQVYAAGTLFGGEIAPFSESRVELRSDAGLSKAEVWLDGEQVAGWQINGAKVFRTGVPVPPNYTWLQWVVEDRNGNRAYSNPIWIKKRG